MILSDVMDELATRIDNIDGLRVHAYPADNVHPPAAIISYPTEYNFDSTLSRGMDRFTLPVIVLVGRVSDRASRDRLSAYLNGSGAKSLKRVIEFEPYPSYMNVTGNDNSSAETPDDPSLNISGDIDLRVDFTPAYDRPPTQRALISRFDGGGTPGSQRSFQWVIRPTQLRFVWSEDGGTALQDEVNPYPMTAGVRTVFRVTLDVDDGAGGHVVSFYEGDTLDGPWTLLQTTTHPGTTSLWVGNTTDLVVGGDFPFGDTNNTLEGKVHGARVLNGIDGTPVANPDFTSHVDGTTSFTDDAGNPWTVTGDASIVGPFTQTLYTAFDAVRVIDAEFDVIQIASTDYLAATLNLDIVGPGGS